MTYERHCGISLDGIRWGNAHIIERKTIVWHVAITLEMNADTCSGGLFLL